jgi:4'-phosphopantetheinyl transferase
LIAVAEGREVGVDLEPVRDDVDHRRLAERFFSLAERRAIESAVDGPATAFFRHWVAKEAVLKAIGVGLRFPLERCEVTITEDERTASVRWRDTADMESTWSVRFLPLEAGWIAAVASSGADWTVGYADPFSAIKRTGY